MPPAFYRPGIANISLNPLGEQAEWARAALTDITSFRWPRLIAFSWWNERWQNDDNPANDTTMRLQDNPELAAVFQELVGNNPNVIGASAPSISVPPDSPPRWRPIGIFDMGLRVLGLKSQPRSHEIMEGNKD